jgi:SSS family solute:Na+ symporter
VISTVDYLLICFYFVIVLFAGWLPSLKKHTSNSFVDFFLAGRSVTLPFFVMSLVATWYGSIVGVGEFIHSYGIVTWFCFGVPYYVIALFFALFFAKKIRSGNILSIPSAIEKKFGKKQGVIVAILLLIITIPAPYSLTLGVVLQMFLPLPLWATILIGTGISLVIVSKGGLQSDLYANSIQFVLMYFGFGLLLFFSWSSFGSPIKLFDKLTPTLQNPFQSHFWLIFSWTIIALQTFVDPSFHQRCSAAVSPVTAKNGILISILFWFVFDSLTMLTGLYSVTYIGNSNPLEVYTVLSKTVLSSPWSGFFLISILSIVMSTLESYLLISSSIVSFDIIGKSSSVKQHKFSNVFILLALAIVASVVAISIPSITTIIYTAASIVVPGLLFMVILALMPTISLRQGSAMFCLLLPPMVVISIIIIKSFTRIQLPFIQEIEPMILGMLVSFLLVVINIEKKP